MIERDHIAPAIPSPRCPYRDSNTAPPVRTIGPHLPAPHQRPRRHQGHGHVHATDHIGDFNSLEVRFDNATLLNHDDTSIAGGEVEMLKVLDTSQPHH